MASRESLLKRIDKSWVSQKSQQLFNQIGFDEQLDDAILLIKKRRVLDFVVTTGSFSARVYGDVGAPKVVSVAIPVITEAKWKKAFALMAKKALFSSAILAEQLPESVLEVFSEVGSDLVPTDTSKVVVKVEGKKQKELDDRAAAVIYRFLDRVVDDPFLIFALRGKGVEEAIIELRRHRLVLAEAKRDQESEELDEVDGASVLIPTSKDFWETSNPKELGELEYNIKADELPAAILKRLDTLPLNGAEDEVEPLLEEAYEHVTTRAQAYGLGL